MPSLPPFDASGNAMLAVMQAQLNNQAVLQNLLGQSMGQQMGQQMSAMSGNQLGGGAGLLSANLLGLQGLGQQELGQPGLHSAAGLGLQGPSRGLASLGSASSSASGSDFHAMAVDTARELLHRQSSSRALTPAQETAARLQRMKEEKAEKSADSAREAEKSRCHLHKKPKKGCKKCDKYEEFLNRGKAEKAALKEKFVSDIRREHDAFNKYDSEPSTNKRGPIELGNAKTFGFPPLFLSQIVESTHLKNLMTQNTFEEVVTEIAQFAEGIEPYMGNTATTPSPIFCCVYRLFTLALDGQDIVALLESTANPYIRCAGFLFVRFGMPVDQLWSWLGEYTSDTEEFQPVKGGDVVMTIGEYVESLLTLERYYTTILPRLPVGAKKYLEAKLAHVPQYRKRTAANMKMLDVFRQEGVRVEAFLSDAHWVAGETLELDESFTSRVRLRIRFANGSEEVVHIGKVILTDGRFDHKGGRPRGGRERSRSRSPTGAVDWTRDKGKGETELIMEFRGKDRDRAVCTSGKEYARRPVSFNIALPMEQGTASHKLIQDETSVTSTKSKRADRSPSPGQAAKKGPSLEHQARMHEIFKKYTASGSSAAAGDSRSHNDIDGPDVMRIG